jgi:hypothetical protein
VTPVAGNTIAIWDNDNRVFQRKLIASVSGSSTCTITCSTQFGASDTTYTPRAGQRVSPWSDNLVQVVDPILAYLATLGPGECVTLAGSFQDGLRMVRSPAAPKSWPYSIGGRITVDLSAIPEVADATNLAGVGVTVVPSIPPAQLELSDLAFFPA